MARVPTQEAGPVVGYDLPASREGFLLGEVVEGDDGRAIDVVYVAANLPAERLTGVTSLVGRRLTEVDPESAPFWLEIWDRVTQSGHGERVEYRAPLIDRWFDCFITPIPDPRRRGAVIFHDITDLRRAEEALHRSEARQQFLLNLNDRLRPIADPVDLQYEAACAIGEFLGANRVGYGEDQGDGQTIVVTRNFTDGVPGIEGSYRYEDYGTTLLRDLAEGQTVVHADVAADPMLSDAEKAAHAAVQVGASVTVPLVKNGRLVAVLFVHHREAKVWSPDELALVEAVAARTWDAVERSRAQAELREREARLGLALDVAELGTWSWDLLTGRGAIDERGAEIVGLEAGDLADVTAAQRERVHPEDLARLDADVAAGLDGEGVFSLTYRVVRGDGSIHHVASRARVIKDRRGRPVRLVGTNRDVTAEREVEAALREREERYRTLFESIDEGFCIIEVIFDGDQPVDYRFLELNPAFARHTGLKDALGRRIREMVPDLETTWTAAMGLVATTRESTRFTEHAEPMDRWFDVFAFPVGMPEQRRVAVIFTDVTERMALERDREAILERERRAREAAEAFLAVMSHELKTPVTTIYGTASLLSRSPDREDLRELLGDIQDEAEQLRRIIDDLLVLSGVERGLLNLAPEPILLQREIPEVVADIQRRFPGVTFKMVVPPGIPPVTADTTALRQVLYNLVSNAAKYAGADGPVTIAVEDHGNRIAVAVLDEGPGVGDDPAALFELFYRAPHTAKRASGTGIGLYVASALLRAMHASIHAETRETGGAAFRFDLTTVRE
jgi:PAS domain S-box-containing protein